MDFIASLPLLYRLLGRVASFGKKGLEKEYTYFRILKKYTSAAPSLRDDNFNSIYLHTVYEYEEQNDSELAKLFYLANCEKAFDDFYNKDVSWAFKEKLVEIIHTNSKVRALKKRDIELDNEIEHFIKLFKRKVHEAASQSNKKIQEDSSETLTVVNQIKTILLPVNEEKDSKILDPSYFIKDIEPIQDIISRKVSHFDELKKSKHLFFQKEQTSLKEAVKKYKKVVLLANGGIGKSTELNVLAHSFSDGEFIPVLKNFKLYTNQPIKDFLPIDWQRVPSEKLLIIMDGLDEVKASDFLTAVKNILFFIEQNKNVNIVLSCRTNFFHLPIGGTVDTLENVFTPIFLNDLSLTSPEVKEFISKRFNIEPEGFINEIYKKGYVDLTTNPFYLIQMLKLYSSNRSLDQNRSSLFEQFITSNIDFDKNKYNLTLYELQHKKGIILKLLEKIALGIETLSKNRINSSELFNIIDQETEFELLIHSLSFKKCDGEDENWQFDHRLLQEYLAARALSAQTESLILKFITFEPEHKRIIPSWINTLTFLFSIFQMNDERFINLLDLILKNDKEVLVKIEREKIAESTRNFIFQSIFNYYKEYNIWINSNKFNYKELAYFGQSKESIDFIIKEIETADQKSGSVINALNIASYFEYKSETKLKLCAILINLIRKNITDADVVYAAINTITDAKLFGSETVSDIVKLLYEVQNDRVRSAIYYLLRETENVEIFLEYVLKGYQILLENEEKDILTGDTYQLRESIKAVESSNGIKRLLKFFQDNHKFEYTYGAEDLLETLLEKAVLIYSMDSSIYTSVYNYMCNELKLYRTGRIDRFIKFFDDSGTRENAFHDTWKTEEDKMYKKSFAISKLITPQLFLFVVQEYNAKRFMDVDLKRLILDMRYYNNPDLVSFERLLQESSSFAVPTYAQANSEEMRRKKQKDAFEILFLPGDLKKEVLRVFSEEGKDQFTKDELFDVRKRSVKHEEWEDHYSESAIKLLRESGKIVKKAAILKFFDSSEMVERRCILMIYEYLRNFKTIEISENQKEWIKQWCMKEIKRFDFKNAITKNGSSTSYEWSAIWLSFFMKQLDIIFPDTVMLDMLSFDYIEGTQWAGIDYLKNKLQKKDVDERIIKNLANSDLDERVLKNHILYAANHGLVSAYPSILKALADQARDVHSRSDMLDIYYNGSKDVDGIKRIFPDSDTILKWNIVKRLIKASEDEFVIEHLEKIVERDNSESFEASTYLVQLQNKVGVNYCFPRILSRKRESHELFDYLQGLERTEFIPKLLTLLKFSYENKCEHRNFDNLYVAATNTLHNMALITEDNLKEVTTALLAFIKENMEKYEDVKYLIHAIERMETQFYMHKSRAYSIPQMRDKLKLI